MKKRTGAGLILGGGALLLMGAAIAGGGNTPATTAASSSATTVLGPTVTASPYTASVTYTCTGSAPDGVDITYGPEGSSYSASSLPFTKTVAMNTGAYLKAQYISAQAQLQGSGQVTCTLKLTQNGTTATQTGTAQGGYNLASAELCESYSGSWDAC